MTTERAPMVRTNYPGIYSVQVAGRTRYRVVIETGRDPSTGKRKQSWRTVDTLKAARALRSRATVAVERGEYVAPKRVTVNEWLDQWMTSKRDLKDTTRESYRHALAPARAQFGHSHLQAIAKADVEKVVTTMLSTGGKQGTGRSSRTVALTLGVLRHAFDDAVEEALLPRNPVSRKITLPEDEEFEAATWTLAQTKEFLAVAAEHRLAPLWGLTMYGMRRGEVLGLRWEDVDLDAGTVTVQRSRVLVTATVVKVQKPKTKKSRRTLPLDDDLSRGLRDLRRRQAEERLARGGSPGSGYLSDDEAGDPIRPEWYSDEFERLAAQAGLPRIRLHDARHSRASIMIDLGVPITVVSAWLGHASTAVTLAVYAHALEGSLDSAGARFDEALRESAV